MAAARISTGEAIGEHEIKSDFGTQLRLRVRYRSSVHSICRAQCISPHARSVYSCRLGFSDSTFRYSIGCHVPSRLVMPGCKNGGKFANIMPYAQGPPASTERSNPSLC
eukprot:scaffold121408_cov30-Tisochrysis_lutea.AAC.15